MLPYLITYLIISLVVMGIIFISALVHDYAAFVLKSEDFFTDRKPHLAMPGFWCFLVCFAPFVNLILIPIVIVMVIKIKRRQIKKKSYKS